VTSPAAAPPEPVKQPDEQLAYAQLLDLGARLGLLVLVASFVLYATGLLEARVAVDELPALWSLSAADFRQRASMPAGWGWVVLVAHGDVAGLAGIAILAGVSVPCLLALLPLAWRRGDRALAMLGLAEAAVIVLAASGWLAGGH
jgi:hypothetical protein